MLPISYCSSPPPRLHRCHEPEVGAENEGPKRAPSEVSRKKYRQGNRETEEYRQRRRTRAPNERPLGAKQKSNPEPQRQCHRNDRPHARLVIIIFRTQSGDPLRLHKAPAANTLALMLQTLAIENWVVTHSPALMTALRESSEARIIELEKDLGQTQVKGQNLLERPQWKWVE